MVDFNFDDGEWYEQTMFGNSQVKSQNSQSRSYLYLGHY